MAEMFYNLHYLYFYYFTIWESVDRGGREISDNAWNWDEIWFVEKKFGLKNFSGKSRRLAPPNVKDRQSDSTEGVKDTHWLFKEIMIFFEILKILDLLCHNYD